MNLVQLKYFEAVCVYKSVSAAAESLHISQPSLSCAIKELEKEFGTRLFKRQHKGMVLTTEGEELLKLSRALLSHANEVERIMSDLGEGRKLLRLGVPPMIGSLTLPKIFREFQSIHSEIQIEILEAGTKELVKLLQENRVDMVLLPHNTPFDNSVRSMEVAHFEVVYCKSAKNNALKNNRVKATDIEGEKIVLFKDSFFQTEEIKKWFSESGVKPNILLQTDQLSTLLNIVSDGVASGFMFRQLIQPKTGLTPLSMEPPLNLTVSLVWNAQATLYNPMKCFIKYMKEFSL